MYPENYGYYLLRYYNTRKVLAAISSGLVFWIVVVVSIEQSLVGNGQSSVNEWTLGQTLAVSLVSMYFIQAASTLRAHWSPVREAKGRTEICALFSAAEI
jgi:ABC-type bacteriocin/lantibiotic exporter with double-glycine peptidase domain